ncbi:MAG TPA: winged helix-turn-helix transcriptional regulator [Spirochaetia bacterium]|nr:winged helix-turn-helix transcriptional regulator [Spirochaetia bacterium]
MSDTLDATSDKELEILAHICERTASNAHVQQRDLARVIGMSLGMTNSILRRLSHKGFLTVRKVNNRNIAYAVTPAGVEAIAKRSYRYLRRTVKNIVLYKQAIEELVVDAKRNGHDRVLLAGESDLSFIVEHLCGKYGLGFTQEPDGEQAAGDHPRRDRTFILYGEAVDDPGESGCTDAAYLGRVLAAKV